MGVNDQDVGVGGDLANEGRDVGDFFDTIDNILSGLSEAIARQELEPRTVGGTQKGWQGLTIDKIVVDAGLGIETHGEAGMGLAIKVGDTD